MGENAKRKGNMRVRSQGGLGSAQDVENGAFILTKYRLDQPDNTARWGDCINRSQRTQYAASAGKKVGGGRYYGLGIDSTLRNQR